MFVNPPVVNHQLGIRRSYLSETRRVAAEFLKRNLQLIVFAQSRLATEILTTYLKDDFEGDPGAPERIRGYRGGYLPNRRREIEKGLRDGAVRAVVSTNALELGIDIGALDVAVMAGYPGTIAATWQRAGRAGRRASRSAAVMVASSAPLDQFVVRNPSYFFDASPERALIDPDNLHILVDHIKCAAFELPFTGDRIVRRARCAGNPALLAEQGLVHRPLRPTTSTRHAGSAVDVDERVVSGRRRQPPVGVVGQLRGRRHDARAARHRRDRLHERPIHASPEGDLHRRGCSCIRSRGSTSKAARRSCARSTATTTRTRSPTTRVTVIDTFETGSAPDSVPAHGEVHVVSRVVGFKKIKFYTNENVGSGELDLPEQQMHTTSYWLTIPRAVMAMLPFTADDRRDGIVGLAFAMKQVAQLLLMCDRHDIGISIHSDENDDQRVFIYDNYPGGIGFSEPLFRMHHELWRRHDTSSRSVPCENGCPGCVGPIGRYRPARKDRRAAHPRPAPRGPTRRRPRTRRGRCRRSPIACVESSRGRTGRRGRRWMSLRLTRRASRCLGGAWLEGGERACFVVDRRRDAVAPTGATWSGASAQRIDANLCESPLIAGGLPAATPLLFFDLETTGLSGGAGTLRVPGRLWMVRGRRIRHTPVSADASRRRAGDARRGRGGVRARRIRSSASTGSRSTRRCSKRGICFTASRWTAAVAARRCAPSRTTLLASCRRTRRRGELFAERARARQSSARGGRTTCPAVEIPERYFQVRAHRRCSAARRGARAQSARPAVARRPHRTASRAAAAGPGGCFVAERSAGAGPRCTSAADVNDARARRTSARSR